jgi:hypothetical protein
VSSLLSEVVDLLARSRSPHAVVGAAALAALGVSRSTIDLDLLTTDRAVLRRDYWSSIEGVGTVVEIRIGDISDPLVGVIRLSRSGERPIDVIVGEGRWQERLIAEARSYVVLGVAAPVADEVGIVQMKLYAGGPQDLWDISQLVAVSPDPERLIREVTLRERDLPRRCRSLWQKVCEG